MSKVCGAVLLLLVCCAKLSVQQCLTPNDDKQITDVAGYANLYRGQQDFSLSLLEQVNKRQPATENVFFSPISVYQALIMAYFLSSNQTEKALHKTLRLRTTQDKIDILKAYKFDKNSKQAYEFSNANRIYYASQLKVKSCMEEQFSDELQKIDFKANPTAAVEKINNWVQENTRGMIADLLPPDAVDQNTNLVLVNAAYFRGRWQSRFPSENTRKAVFYISPSENTFVEMMTQEGTFNHDMSEKLGAHILQLPYEDEAASMYILLPPFVSTDGVDKILANLNSKTLADIVSKKNLLMSRTVEVSLPKFAVERTIELGPVLEGLGVGDLLQPTSDLSTLTGNPYDRLTLGGAIHKARVQVDEDGTQAAAATSIFTFRSGRPAETVQFNCNHPFVYLIYEPTKKAILFAGIFRRPQTSVA